jgi:hypothetical protein
MRVRERSPSAVRAHLFEHVSSREASDVGNLCVLHVICFVPSDQAATIVP